MLNRIQFITAMVLFALLLSACQSEPAATEATDGHAESVDTQAEPTEMASTATPPPVKQCSLTAGWDPWEPYHYIAAGNQVQGLDIEIIQAVAEGAECEISFQQGSWSELLNGLRSGDVDVMMGATQIPEREEFAYFSEPYREDSFMLYVLAGGENQVEDQSLEQLMADGFRLGVTQGYYYGEAFDELQTNPDFADQIVDASVGEMNFTHLLDGQIDGFLEHPPVATAIKRRRGDTDPILATELTIGGGPVTFMFSRASADEDVVIRFNSSLQALKDSDQYQPMLERYME